MKNNNRVLSVEKKVTEIEILKVGSTAVTIERTLPLVTIYVDKDYTYYVVANDTKAVLFIYVVDWRNEVMDIRVPI